MARKKRVWDPQKFYHIVSRGNRRENLFNDEGDFKTFMYILQTVNKKAPFELASYCLMSNHYHLQLRSKEKSISKVMFLINKSYANYYNNKNNFTGHVFEKRFFDDVIHTEIGMLAVSRYIHLNPVKAGMVENAENYKWSSYRYYLNTLSGPLINMESLLDYYSGTSRRRGINIRSLWSRSRKSLGKFLLLLDR